MKIVSTRLSNQEYTRLEKICRITNSAEEDFLKKAVRTFIEDSEDYLDAIKSLKSNGRRYSFEDMRNGISGLED